MNEIEIRLLESLRDSNLRDDFNVNALSSNTGTANASAESAASARVGLLHGELSEPIIGAAIQVHRWLGPGQLESTYQRALAKELAFCGIAYRAQVPITSRYRGEAVGEFFADFIVEDKIILELKVVSRILAVHRAQLNSYLRATGLQLGLLLNFHVPVLHMGVKRVLP
jgi:GxxExxY protein